MARLFTSGLELGTTAEFSGGVSAAYVVTTPVRTGAYSLKFVGPTDYAIQTFSANCVELYFRMAMRISTGSIGKTANFLEFRDSDAALQLALKYNAGTQTFTLLRGTTLIASGSTVLSADVWYVIEGHILMDQTAGEVVIKINSLIDISFSGDTVQTALVSVRSFKARGIADSTYHDDFAVNDTTGSYQNSWIGTGGVLILKPNAEGDQLDWTPSAGTVHWSLVDEVPANTTDWVQGTNAGLIDLYNLEALPATIKLIDMVEVVMQAALSQTGYNEIQDVVQHGGTIYTGGNAQPVTSVIDNYVLYKGTAWYLAPGGTLAWGTADIDALQAGVKIP